MSEQMLPEDRHQRQAGDFQWTVIATAPDQLVAEMWQQLLREEGIPSMLAPQDAVSFLGVSPSPVRLMVPLDLKTSAEELLDGLLTPVDFDFEAGSNDL